MNSGNLSEPIKYCLFLEYMAFDIPLSLIYSAPHSYGARYVIKILYLPDEFTIFVAKKTDSVITAGVNRKRVKTDEKPDDGYALRFYFSMTGFDEEAQSAILRHDDARATTTFLLSDNVRDRITKSHVLFDLFVTVQMLEFRNLDKCHPGKEIGDKYASYLKKKLTKKEVELLCGVLKNPNLEDVFTGRLAPVCMKSLMLTIASMSQNLTKLAEYVSDNYKNMTNVKLQKFEVDNLLNYVGLTDKKRLTIEEATEQYIIAHKLGLDCFKTSASEYLESVLDKEYNVLDIFEAAIMVQDKYLIDKAIECLLKRFQEITRSAKFNDFSNNKTFMTRVMIHTARVWVHNRSYEIFG